MSREVKVITTHFDASIKALLKITPKDQLGKVINAGFARVANTAAKEVKIPSASKIARDEELRQAKKLKRSKVQRGFESGGVEVYTSPRLPYPPPKAPAKAIVVGVPGMGWKRPFIPINWRINNGVWARAKAAVEAQRAQFAKLLKEWIKSRKASRGLPAKPYAHAALAVDQPSTAPSYVRNANYRGNDHRDKTRIRSESSDTKHEVTFTTTSESSLKHPYAVPIAMSRQAKGITEALKRTTRDNTAKLLKQFGVTVK